MGWVEFASEIGFTRVNIHVSFLSVRLWKSQAFFEFDVMGWRLPFALFSLETGFLCGRSSWWIRHIKFPLLKSVPNVFILSFWKRSFEKWRYFNTLLKIRQFTSRISIFPCYVSFISQSNIWTARNYKTNSLHCLLNVILKYRWEFLKLGEDFSLLVRSLHGEEI